MATISTPNNTSILSIRAFLGLNENPDGDTVLKHGEMSEMRNFRITLDKHLQIRPGTKTIVDLHKILLDGMEGGDAVTTQRVYGVWHGTVGGNDHMLVAYSGHIFDVNVSKFDVNVSEPTATICGKSAERDTTFFAFGGKVYLLNGEEYLCWDGKADEGFKPVEGYAPIVQTATTPEGAGTLLENVNRLTAKRRVQFSPNGTAKTFKLPESDITSVDAVKLLDEDIAFEADVSAGTVTLSEVPSVGTNTLEVTYSKGESARDEVSSMMHSELFNGGTDTRVFLYGNGTNKTIYSGVEYESGQPSAEYFPDLFEMSVGESNTPITALVRHYSRMMAFKPNSAWVVQADNITLADGISTPAFYVQPVNRQFGNEALGQVRLLENNPITFDVGGVYQWKSSSGGYVAGNENNAKRISDRVGRTLAEFNWKAVKSCNCKHNHEFWILQGGVAAILNYANDTWYVYRDLRFDQMLEVDGEVYGFSAEGRVMHMSRRYRNDDGDNIDCYAATGAMDFNRDWQTKNSPMIFVAMQPESNARIFVTAETNRRSDYPDKAVAYSLATFGHTDFAHYSFGTNRKPQVKRLKMKVKKATFYRLVYTSNSASATATVIQTDVQLRYGGNVK